MDNEFLNSLQKFRFISAEAYIIPAIQQHCLKKADTGGGGGVVRALSYGFLWFYEDGKYIWRDTYHTETLMTYPNHLPGVKRLR